MTHPHVFVDESKARGYFLVAAVVPRDNIGACRSVVRSLIMPRQRRIHFKSESDPRRRKIMDAICELGIETIVYDASVYTDQRHARQSCLGALVEYAFTVGAERLILELDDSAVKSDRELLFTLTRNEQPGSSSI